MKNLNEKNYNQVLSEANDFFLAQGVSIIGEGYKEIASNAALFESYVDQLTEGCSADDAATMAQLMANTNANILRESSMTGIQPIASLSMPVIRKLWPKFALKEAIDSEVAKTPRFVVSYTKPYMFRGGEKGEERIELPHGLVESNEKLNREGIQKTYKPVEATLKVGEAAVIPVDTNVANTPSAVKAQPIDELLLDEVKPADGEAVKLPARRLGVYGNGLYDLGNGDQLLVQLDGAARKVTFAVVGGTGKTYSIKARAGVSSEYNEESWSVGFDIKRQDVDIPTGQHLNAPLPIEALNDMMALYQIDGTKETVDLMTNVFSQKLDLEILNFLEDSLLAQPSNDAWSHYKRVGEFQVTFDCKPAAGFAGSPKAWREELKPLIDHVAQKIKNQTYLQAGTFSIVCNPLDAQILANVDWSFRGGAGGNVDGVAVDYSVGTYVGANAYKVIASVNVPQGEMLVIFTPSSKTQMTYKYYPYTFSTEMGYIDPNRSRTPSIMMTKRHTFYEFIPAIAVINIANNDGTWFNDYVSTKAWEEAGN